MHGTWSRHQVTAGYAGTSSPLSCAHGEQNNPFGKPGWISSRTRLGLEHRCMPVPRPGFVTVAMPNHSCMALSGFGDHFHPTGSVACVQATMLHMSHACLLYV